MRVFLAFLASLLLALPASALLVDVEPDNNLFLTAPTGIVRQATPVADVGVFELTESDVDFVKIEGLIAGDIVNIMTTPMLEPFDFPDTDLALVDAFGFEIAFNDDLGDSLGSALQVLIEEDGDYFARVAGFDPEFDTGPYALTISIVPIPEPGTALLLGGGLLAVAGLRRRARA